MSAPSPALPWYRVPVAWIALLLPLILVLAAVHTVRLAANGPADADPDLVSRRAGMQTQTSDEDLQAVRLGLSAELALAADGGRIEVNAAGIPPVPRLQLHWVHATQARFDREAELQLVGPGSWQGELPPGLNGRYGLRLSPPDRSWRLLGAYERGARVLPLVPAYAGPLTAIER